MDAVTRVVSRGALARFVWLAAAVLALQLVEQAAMRAANPAPSRARSFVGHCRDLPVRQAPAPAPAEAPLETVTLERRWIGDFASSAEVDAALGTEPVVAWEPFLYLHDAQPRLAVASEIYASTTSPTYAFGKDEYDGIWLVRGPDGKGLTAKRPVTYTRDVYLLPTGTSFRGAR